MSYTTKAMANFDTKDQASEQTFRQQAGGAFERSVLVVEDNLVNQKIALKQLEQLGYKTHAVKNGREALSAIEKQFYDAILMDCQMPEMDGYEATEAIRRRESLANHSIIIAMTSNSNEADKERCFSVGMDDFISKPVKTDELEKVLKRWLNSGWSKESEDKSAESVNLVPPVDMEYLLDLSGGDIEVLKEMVDAFLTQMSADLERLHSALESSDADKVKEISNSCVGACLSCGMTILVQPLRMLEEIGEEGGLEEARQIKFHLSRGFSQVKNYLKSYLYHHLNLQSLKDSAATKPTEEVQKKILIIVSNPIVAKLLNDKFRDAGYQIKIANDGEPGVKMLEQMRPDVILLDLVLPMMSGVKVLQWMRSRPEFKTLPVVVFSNAFTAKMLPQEIDPATHTFEKDKISSELITDLVRDILS